MGLEAACTVRVGRKSAQGKALLESESLIVRGDLRVEIGFDQMRDVSVDGDTLIIKTGDQEVRLQLGERAAEVWMRRIKEPKGLFEKLELVSEPRVPAAEAAEVKGSSEAKIPAAESRMAAVDVQDPVLLAALRDRFPGLAEGRVPQGATVIFFGAETREALRKIQLLRARMADTGALWILRPKGSKALAEAEVLHAIREAGLADTKVVALSRTHTAHKAIVPVELRGSAVRRRPAIVSLPPPPPGATKDIEPTEAKKPKSAPSKKIDGRDKAH